MNPFYDSDNIDLLLVDDDELFCDIAGYQLDKYGITTYTACSIAEAVEVFKSHKIDVILTDIHLKNETGFDLLKIIREIHSNFPIVLLTGDENLDLAVNAIKLGVQDYFLKPVVYYDRLAFVLKRAAQNYKLILQNKDLTQKKNQSEKHYEQLFNIIEDGIIICEYDHESDTFMVNSLNNAAQQLLNITISQIIGQDFSECCGFLCKCDIIDKIKEVYKTGHPCQCKCTRTNELGHYQYYYTNKFYKLASGEVGIIIRDITTQKMNERFLEKAKEDLVIANSAKSLFLANMSHEVRTPMNAIIGLSELLLEDNLKEDQKEYINIIIRSADSLLKLMNDILDLANIEAGNVSVNVSDIDLSRFIDQIKANYEHQFLDHNLQMIIEMDRNLPDTIKGSPKRLYQVVSHFLNNSLKFTHKGHVTFRISLIERQNHKAKISFTIEDTGIGISQQHLKHLFDSFTQIDASSTRKYGGSGLGLAICKRLADIMECTIDVESEVGKGSTFTLEGTFYCK